MKNLSLFLFGIVAFVLALFFQPLLAFAQDGTPISTPEFLMALLSSIGGLKGASTLAIVGVVIQLLIKFLSSELCNQFFKNFTGFGKLLVISILTWAGGVASLMLVEKLDFMTAFMHSTALNALMVWINQIIQQYAKQKELKQ